MCVLWLRWCVPSFAERGEGACMCVFLRCVRVRMLSCGIVECTPCSRRRIGTWWQLHWSLVRCRASVAKAAIQAVPTGFSPRHSVGWHACFHACGMSPTFAAGGCIRHALNHVVVIAGVAGHTQPCFVHRNVPRLRYSCGLVSHGYQLRGGEARQRYRSRGVTNSHQNWVV